MVDDTVIPDFTEPLKAKVSIEPLEMVLKRIFSEQFILSPGTSNDDKPSLITDYSTWEYSIVMKPFMKQFQYWVDEYRIISEDQPHLLIGRSYYKGVFWSHLIIEFERV